MNLDLEDRAWFDAIPVGGIGVRVVEGISVTCGVCLGQTTGTCDACVGGANLFPSHNWVALSEQKCQTCKTFGDPDDYEDGWCMWVVETTDGDPTKIVQVHSEHGWRQVSYAPDWNSDPCPDCHGSGRPLVPVMVPCPKIVTPDAMERGHWCQTCRGTGRLSIGSVTVEAVVPIRRMEGDRGNPQWAVIVIVRRVS